MPNYKKYTPDRNETHDWNKDKVLEGIYTAKRKVITENGETNMYTVEKPGGVTVDVWGKSMLDSFFLNMKIGTQVKVTYEGKKKSKKGGREYHSFDFDYDDSTAVEDQSEDKDIIEAAKETFNA
jgi:hypothetical protein